MSSVAAQALEPLEIITKDAAVGAPETGPNETGPHFSVLVCWLILTLAIVCEVIGTICMQKSDAFKNVLPSIGIFVFYAISFSAFPFALQGIDLSIAYAVWAGCGIVLTSLYGIFVAGESVNVIKIVCIVGILICVVGLKYSEGKASSS
mmetsp:Transcript_11281/g.18426  ORF Transcript_11281/g.18426 Transcript_11281/m.18426 type:complete len:149 (-) Transcript_11281:2396-2842(-)